jgi:hypothetical protein
MFQTTNQMGFLLSGIALPATNGRNCDEMLALVSPIDYRRGSPGKAGPNDGPKGVCNGLYQRMVGRF